MPNQTESVVILLPIYTDKPNELELSSFKQCIKILNKHHIVLAAPDGLNMSVYLKIINGNDNIRIRYFSKKYFGSARRHNRLLLTKSFYEMFSEYKYLMIYHLDAYVFKDELAYWCSKEYDYLGAPWIRFTDNGSEVKFDGVGNGGFSLRKIDTMQYLLNNWQKHFGFKTLLGSRLIKKESKLRYVLNFTLQALTLGIYKATMDKVFIENEDYLLGKVFCRKLHVISTPTFDEARAFAFEMHADYLYQMNNGKLPFGCHGWYRYNTDFWKAHINVA